MNLSDDMNLPDEQLEALETYLDGELSREATATLERQLKSDPSLAMALATLREERAMRHEAFALMEPATVSTARLMGATRLAATREQVWGSRYKILRQVSAAAACIVVGLSVGWLARGRGAPATPAVPGTSSKIALHSNPPSAVANSYQPVDNPNVRLVSDGDSTRIVPRVNGFNVTITDDLGRVLGTQRFDTLNEAQQFSHDVGKWQTKQRELRNGGLKLVGDEF